MAATTTLAAICMASCSEGREPYPNVITEFADVHTDGRGRLCHFLTDDGTHYTVSNSNIPPHRPDTVYRAVVGFVPGTTDTGAATQRSAHIHTLTGAMLLADSTDVVHHDPTGIASMWATARYINMQLTPLTQGGIHHWGYAVDSCRMAGDQGWAHAHHHLSVHHVQGSDPMSYSDTRYCSIKRASIPHYNTGDTVSVTLHTFNGQRRWTFTSR